MPMYVQLPNVFFLVQLYLSLKKLYALIKYFCLCINYSLFMSTNKNCKRIGRKLQFRITTYSLSKK